MTYLLSIDPATKTGVSIFDITSGDLIECYTLVSKGSVPWGGRALDLLEQLKEAAHEHLKHVSLITYEKNKRTSVLVVSVPLVLSMACPKAKIGDATGITPSEWKKYVRQRVDTSNICVKGMDALDALKPGWIESYDVDSDDAADSILIGLTFLEKLESLGRKDAQRSQASLK